ncbi:exodeoxyribonuclease III [Candidatus Xianfuyuplasma coldseepsis]|uniref:Exodeoxyribonuclease III n=1 Tax=Candidatus Xianfuyuplasma coldseepsis TaxID=2782163 RepID=A0A7L7KS83_9MOLU|nr:exodeoxyribonuclease III [Xianfuyuplasma coldseepsis]QMS84648.1 exodeoxyribonuclease III [Xianfuyuplasma coldseepsis]
MKFISWNVNGLRACMKKGFASFFEEQDADFVCLQETKMQQHQKEFAFEGYHEFWNDADRKGYSGTLIYTKHEPLHVQYGLNDGAYNDEGRIITLEYDSFYLVNTYVPNVKRDLSRIPYRMTYEDRVRAYYVELSQSKPVILCGDLNVAHNEIDLKNDKSNIGNAGFTDEERGKFNELLDAGFTDTFRHLYPTKEQYSWWSYMFKSREKNVGWRIDYFVVSNRLVPYVQDSIILDHVLGSDHCPVLLHIDL